MKKTKALRPQTFDEWMRSIRPEYKPSDDGMDTRKLRTCGAEAVRATKLTENSGDTLLAIAIKTLRQISDTPRNKGARRNASATLRFIETQQRK